MARYLIQPPTGRKLSAFYRVAPAKYRWEVPIEISGGAISLSRMHEDLLDVETNSVEGFLRLLAFNPDHFSEEQILEFIHSQWAAKSRPLLGSIRWESSALTVIPAASAPYMQQVTQLASWDERPAYQPIDSESRVYQGVELSSNEIIEQLAAQPQSIRKSCELVLSAEVKDFNEEELIRIVPLLYQFIATHRFSDDPDIIVAIGSAVRKLVMNMPLSDFDTLAVLFDPRDTKSIPCQIELELVKAIVWRLSIEPPQDDDTHREVAQRLFEVATTYLRPRLVTQKNYAAVSLNAVLAILLLRTSCVNEVIDALKSLDAKWFSELVVRRSRQLREQFSKTYSPEAAGQITRCFFEAEERLG